MFGYVRAMREELTVRQDILYRAAYCGLCREMGRCTGQCSRLTLSYDMVFLYTVRMALRGSIPTIKKGRCLVHPFKKRQYVASDSELEYAARVSALLTHGKVCDDAADELGMKRFLCKLALPFSRHAKKRAALDELYEKIAASLSELAEVESQKLKSVDAPAEIFGRLLGDVFAYGFSGSEERIAREIGFRTGRWIYAVDAADDIDEDMKKGEYNPFLMLYDEFTDDVRRLIEVAAANDLARASAAADLADDSIFTPIINNILHYGMPHAAKKAIYKESDSEQKSVRNTWSERERHR